MHEDRRMTVLRAIVEEYVRTQEPVGSKALVERHQLAVSPATIRNDMSNLEEEGYIVQPHTSAGRVPTERGYRMFVDRLSEVRPLSQAERKAIHEFLDGAVSLDDVMHRTVRLLADLTGQIALVQYPTLSRSRLMHVDLLAMSETRVMIVAVADNGRLEQRTVDLGHRVPAESLDLLRTRLRDAVMGKLVSELPQHAVTVLEAGDRDDKVLATPIVAAFLEAAVEHPEERVLLGGTANLARFGRDFDSRYRPLLEALEEQVVLLQLLGNAGTGEGVTVRIGSENHVEGLETATVVSVGYGPTELPVASLGVVGPTRMDYPGTLSSVGAVARYIGRLLQEG
jgi:heat-inducible transcriptional repressor